jgi:hypothetical protein
MENKMTQDNMQRKKYITALLLACVAAGLFVAMIMSKMN